MTICIYGGAFDPLHLGHESIIGYLATHDQVDQLLVVPSGIPVLKSSFMFSSDARLAMVRSVASQYGNVDVIDYEINKLSPSYMIETLQYLSIQYPGQSMNLVIGFDQFRSFHEWFGYADILDMVQLWVIQREGVDSDAVIASLPTIMRQRLNQVVFHSYTPPVISSSMIRDSIDAGRDVSDFVSDPILHVLNDLN